MRLPRLGIIAYEVIAGVPMSKVYEVYFDGSARPNPGRMSVGVFCLQTGYTLSLRTGHGTNNEAEWQALLYALPYAYSLLNNADVYLIGDSQVVVNAMKGTIEMTNPILYTLYALCRPFAHVPGLHFEWVERSFNLAHTYASPL